MLKEASLSFFLKERVPLLPRNGNSKTKTNPEHCSDDTTTSLQKKKETRWFKFFNINSRTTHSSTLVGAAQEQKRLEWRKRGEPEVRNGKQKLELEYHFYDGKKGKGSTRSTLGMENKWRKAQQPLLQPQTVLVYILKNRLLLRKCTNGCIWWDRW